jgi:hypothetical protein
MTVRHCPGCPGYVHGWAGTDCAGMAMGEFETPEVVPPMRFGDRMRALIGLPVFLGVTAGPLEDDEGDPEYPDLSIVPGMGWDKEAG